MIAVVKSLCLLLLGTGTGGGRGWGWGSVAAAAVYRLVFFVVIPEEVD